MHPLEVILILACLAPLLLFVALPGRPLPAWMPLIVGLLLVLDLTIAGPRWMMLPMYPAALAGVGLAVLRLSAESRPALVVAWGSLFLLGGALSLGLVSPAREEVPPGGRFGAGVIVDSPGIAAAASGAAGEGASPVLRIWYPTAAANQAGMAPGLPAFLRSWFAAAPPALAAAGAGGFPVLVGIPGWDGARVENTALVRELVSHGFVVATLEYPPPAADTPDATAALDQRRLRSPMDFSSEAAFNDTVRRGDQLTRTRAHDAIRVLDRLARLNSSDPTGRFTHRLDLAHAGVFGFSLGGAVAAQACWQDERFRAAVNMDGWRFADAAQYGLRQPYLLLSEDGPLPTESDLTASNPVHRYTAALNLLDYQRTVRSFRRYGGLYVRISGSRHQNFAGQATPLWQGSAGIAVQRVVEIVNTYVLAFFEKYLDGLDSPLLAGDSQAMPEAHVQVWTAEAVKARTAANS